MASWIWVLIPLAAVIGAYIIDYQKNKLKWQNQTNSSEEEFEELRNLMVHLKKRIENLEAIAVGDSENPGDALNQIQIDVQDSIKTENQQAVAKKAKNKRN